VGSTLIILCVLCGVVLFWRDSLRTRELALQVCRRTCASYDVQLLDDTVAMTSIWPVFDQGRLALRRVYLFEYSLSSMDRRTGSLTLTRQRVESVYLEPDDSSQNF
jgi:hypothetical protein